MPLTTPTPSNHLEGLSASKQIGLPGITFTTSNYLSLPLPSYLQLHRHASNSPLRPSAARERRANNGARPTRRSRALTRISVRTSLSTGAVEARPISHPTDPHHHLASTSLNGACESMLPLVGVFRQPEVVWHSTRAARVHCVDRLYPPLVRHRGRPWALARSQNRFCSR